MFLMFGFLNIQMFGFSNIQMFGFSNIQMFRFSNIQMFRVSIIQMAMPRKVFLFTSFEEDCVKKTSQELRMLSSVTLNCQVTKIVMDSGSQL